MKLYRDMTREERAEEDHYLELRLHHTKLDAELEMNWFDSLPPEERKRQREKESAWC